MKNSSEKCWSTHRIRSFPELSCKVHAFHLTPSLSGTNLCGFFWNCRLGFFIPHRKIILMLPSAPPPLKKQHLCFHTYWCIRWKMPRNWGRTVHEVGRKMSRQQLGVQVPWHIYLTYHRMDCIVSQLGTSLLVLTHSARPGSHRLNRYNRWQITGCGADCTIFSQLSITDCMIDN